MKYQCPRCEERKKDWESDDPVCGFTKQGNFKPDNWNCATLNALRELSESPTYCGDYRMSVIAMEDIGFGILKWYKDRGNTEDFYTDQFIPGTLKYAQQLLGDVEPDYINFWD